MVSGSAVARFFQARPNPVPDFRLRALSSRPISLKPYQTAARIAISISILFTLSNMVLS